MESRPERGRGAHHWVPNQPTESRSVLGLAGGLSSERGFGPVRQISAGVLNVGYVELGPSRGTPVVLLHGFPYDIHSYEQVAPLLARRGCRVIVPYLRGHGSTTFRSASTPRNVDQAAFALDIIAALWPERVKALVSVTGYLITNLEANQDSAAMYARTAAAFDNPDYEAIVIGNYRWRQSLIPAEPEYADRLQQTSR